MTATDLLERLAERKTLGSVSREELAWLASHGSLRHLNTGDVLSTRGALVEGMFVVLSGHVAIYVDRGAGLNKVMAWRGGEVAGLLPYSRLSSPPGDSVAQEPTTILADNEEALEHLRALLALDVEDHQGVHYTLLNLLLETSRDEEAEALLDAFSEDDSLTWLYSRPLVLYRQPTKRDKAASALKKAVAANRRVFDFLLDPDLLAEAERHADATDEEAVRCADELYDYWQETPGAQDWLAGKGERL